MFKLRLKLTALAVSILFVFVLCAPAAAQEKGAAIFKLPDGWMPTDKTDVGPIIFLHPKRPAVMFVTYPKPGEATTEGQRGRLRSMAVSMFFHDEKAQLDWEVKSIQPHQGDAKADIATAKQGDMEVQVVTYERTTGVRPFIYGYMAMRHGSGKKDDDAPFVDETGKGVKDFDKLWKSFTK